MSIKLMTAAWDLPLTGNKKLVLMALADFANDEGLCWPSIGTISTKTGASYSTIKRLVNELILDGYVEKSKQFRDNGSQTSNAYIVTPYQNEPPVQNDTPPPVQNDTPPPVQNVPPLNHHNNHQVEPSSKKTKAKNIEVIDQHRQTAKEAIEYLNEKTGSRFKSDLESNLTPIIAKLKAGYTRENIGYVIDVKCQEWIGTDMEKHLNPTTLFRPANFDKYLNQKPKPVDIKQLEVELYERAKNELGMTAGQAALYVSDELTKRGM